MVIRYYGFMRGYLSGSDLNGETLIQKLIQKRKLAQRWGFANTFSLGYQAIEKTLSFKNVNGIFPGIPRKTLHTLYEEVSPVSVLALYVALEEFHRKRDRNLDSFNSIHEILSNLISGVYERYNRAITQLKKFENIGKLDDIKYIPLEDSEARTIKGNLIHPSNQILSQALENQRRKGIDKPSQTTIFLLNELEEKMSK